MKEATGQSSEWVLKTFLSRSSLEKNDSKMFLAPIHWIVLWPLSWQVRGRDFRWSFVFLEERDLHLWVKLIDHPTNCCGEKNHEKDKCEKDETEPADGILGHDEAPEARVTLRRFGADHFSFRGKGDIGESRSI